MGDVNLQLVREFFELHLFRVLTNWQQDAARQRSGENSAQVFVENVQPIPIDPQFLLRLEDVPAIERAVVEVRAWHGDRFYPSVIEANPVLSQFVEEESLAQAREIFQSRPFSTILVVSELPSSPEPRARSLELFQRAGIGHVLEFTVVLQGLLEKVSASATYAPSPTLQLIRLLKRYKLIRNMQMEFDFPFPLSTATPFVDRTAPPHDPDQEELLPQEDD